MTASYAIMLGEGETKSPAAVAGMQIDYDRYVRLLVQNFNTRWHMLISQLILCFFQT